MYMCMYMLRVYICVIWLCMHIRVYVCTLICFEDLWVRVVYVYICDVYIYASHVNNMSVQNTHIHDHMCCVRVHVLCAYICIIHEYHVRSEYVYT